MPFLDREGVDVDTVGERVDAGIVDQDVEPPERGKRLFDAVLDGRLLADVHSTAMARGSSPAARSAPAVDIGDRDRRAAFGKAPGDRPADAGGGAGYEGNPAGEVGLHGIGPDGGRR